MRKGLYIHIPFCKSKCPYCDFYSVCESGQNIQDYTDAVCAALIYFRDTQSADTLYFGGGTPSMLSAGQIARMIFTARECFGLQDAEITVEVNPGDVSGDFLERLLKSGVNRLSVGIQSVFDEELRFLGRRHTAKEGLCALQTARQAGFTNISADMMIGLYGQTVEKVRGTVNTLLEKDITHLSAYLLKQEEGTPFGERSSDTVVADEEIMCELYEGACEAAEKGGLFQYEISNFAKAGYESRHNLKYWRCEEYLGIGPSAHSFLGGQRFFFDRDVSAFIEKAKQGRFCTIPDGIGGGFEEEVMLGLRLTKGINKLELSKKYNKETKKVLHRIPRFEKMGLIAAEGENIRLTRKGFLLSNAIITELLY